jgi:hypothetical protein
MVEASTPGAVSLSRVVETGTSRHPPPQRDSGETTAETPDLKALAQLVIGRDSQRDGARDRVPQPASAVGSHGETVPAADAAALTWDEAEEERAAVVQHKGNIVGAWAQGFARLHPDRLLRGVPTRRWLRLVDDIGLFLDSAFCVSAAALGWGPYDLFGCDGDRPFARIDQLGLLWLLNGGRLVALTSDTATIKTLNGSTLTHRRHVGNEPGRVLAWELL